jgi:hypothetical protein
VKSGHYVGGARLGASSTATTVRSRNGRPIITDGPFAETKEQLGGYHLVDCRDLDEAIAIAMRIPTLRVGGSVEVRPLDPVPDPVRRAPSTMTGDTRSAVRHPPTARGDER